MKKSFVAAVLAVALGSLSGAASAQMKPDVMVKQRQAAMTLIGKYWGPIAGMASGKVSPYNADVVARNGRSSWGRICARGRRSLAWW